MSREIRRGAGADGVYRPAAAQAAARARLARPKIRRLDADPVLRERVVDPPGGSGPVPRGRIAARPRLENPDDGGACAPVRKQIHPGAGCVQGAGSLRSQLRVEGALRTGRTRRVPRCPPAGEARAQGQGARCPGRRPPVCARPRGDEGAVPGHWEADPIIAGRPPAAP